VEYQPSPIAYNSSDEDSIDSDWFPDNRVPLGVARSLEIFSRTICFSRDTVDYFDGCPQWGQNVFVPPSGNWD